ncbi:hypothetical protein RJ639_033187 [Escallonia herrerae]|uniref:Uncharacterized protein n=1 Tax=Escallonia herrerae TaxID=1293975 RepID=A0AA89BBD8_9ASTE|nr:hypothetical protein RJ639_033187 [Escallonia herrerae]
METKSLSLITHQSFFAAVQSGDLESVKTVIKNEGSDPASISALMAVQNGAGETALYVAAQNNFQAIFSYLLKFSDYKRVIIRAKSGLDAFHVAAKRGHLGMHLFATLSSSYSRFVPNICSEPLDEYLYLWYVLKKRQHFGIFGSDSQRRIRRASGSKSFSWSVYSANISDEDESDHEKIYAL